MSGVTIIAPIAGETIIVNSGARGPAGPAGPAGAAEAHIHTQASAAAEWIVNHNFGARPLVQVFSAGGAEIEANIIHITDNQVRIYFAAAQAGTARCI